MKRKLSSAAAEVVSEVNPFIGTVEGSGNTHSGGQVPAGMISWSPQSANSGWSPAGCSYHDDRINGFGLIHLSGAGCSVTGELPFIPCRGDLNTSRATHRGVYSPAFAHTNETASPGFYSVELSPCNIGFENTATERAGIAQLDFPATAKANVVLNPNADGVANAQFNLAMEIPGVGGVLVLSQSFLKAVLYLANGKKLTLTTRNAFRDNKYIQSLTLNGQAGSKLWLTGAQLKSGAVLRYVMAGSPNPNWGAAVSDAPPSFGALPAGD